MGWGVTCDKAGWGPTRGRATRGQAQQVIAMAENKQTEGDMMEEGSKGNVGGKVMPSGF